MKQLRRQDLMSVKEYKEKKPNYEERTIKNTGIKKIEDNDKYCF